MVLAALKVTPFTTIFLGALAGGLMAVIVAPERVQAFADIDKHVPAWLAQVKGVWAAIARGYVSTTGGCPTRLRLHLREASAISGI